MPMPVWKKEYTAARAEKLDNLDTTISSRAAPDDILVDPSTDKIDGSLIDAAISSRATPADVDSQVHSRLNTAVPASPTTDSLYERIKTLDDNYTAARAAKLDNLDAAVSSRATPAQVRSEVDAEFTERGATAARFANLDNLDVAVSSRSSHAPADVWSYGTRTLTQSKFPFWSAIITQTQGSVSIPSGSTVYVDIQPPSGETWLIWVDYSHTEIDKNYQSNVKYYDYDGTTRRMHFYKRRSPTTTYDYGVYFHTYGLSLMKVLTNSLYGSLCFYQSVGSEKTAYYGYSGFKLSKPLWSPKRIHNPDPKPWKRKRTKPLPAGLEALEKYAFDIYGINPEKPDEYDVGISLEENTPLAVDPATNFPVERFTAVVQASTLADLLAKFKAGTLDPVKAGYRKYLNKWKAEGIDFGI